MSISLGPRESLAAISSCIGGVLIHRAGRGGGHQRSPRLQPESACRAIMPVRLLLADIARIAPVMRQHHAIVNQRGKVRGAVSAEGTDHEAAQAFSGLQRLSGARSRVIRTSWSPVRDVGPVHSPCMRFPGGPPRFLRNTKRSPLLNYLHYATVTRESE